MTVLIADNDRAVSGLLHEVLQQSGLTSFHAYDGEAAARMARDPRLEVLVCDLDMPGATGLEVLASLQSLGRPPLTIVISGYLDPSIEEQLRRLPFVRVVMRKPFDLLAFAGNVRRLVAEARHRAAAEGAQRAEGGPANGGLQAGPGQA